jgi:hypothetical protein
MRTQRTQQIRWAAARASAGVGIGICYILLVFRNPSVLSPTFFRIRPRYYLLVVTIIIVIILVKVEVTRRKLVLFYTPRYNKKRFAYKYLRGRGI